jgi:3-mercaptopyruvate sulfurtransferase SseA
MKHLFRHSPYAIIAVFVCLATFVTLSPRQVFANTTEHRSPLVTPAWLEAQRTKGDILLIDASPRQLFSVKHIAGAVNVDVFSYGGRSLSPAEMEPILQSWGTSSDKRIVIYDQGGAIMATSLFYDLHYYGFPIENLFVLDGGLSKWQELGGPVTSEATPAPPRGNFRITKVRDDMRVRLPEFVTASGDPKNNALVDALDASYHVGATKFFDRAGHIPNAISLPSEELFNADKTFKSPTEIKQMLDYLGIKPEQQIHSHCGGGMAASVPFFAMKFMLGYPNVKLYKESQMEWLKDERGLPFWTYARPNLARDKQWVSGWNAEMLRAFGVSRFNIIDIRSPGAFQLGHVPFARNIPAESFKSNLGNPTKLAELLGAAGVDVTQEAVVVSDGGLSPAAALAFLTLEKMGQQKVSVLFSSMDDWGLSGLPLTKPASTAAPVAGSAPPRPQSRTNYPVATRSGVLVGRTNAAAGPFPRVYVSAGKTAPQRFENGKVIHVPYTSLLNADGTPKPAKEIWALLDKAGVPRYAEIVCVGDDTGEAAVNYFIFKLMGYPDVKVLAS